MRLTTLLDTVNQGGSGQWPVTDSTSTTDDHQTFDQLVADFIPCRSNDPDAFFSERPDDVAFAKSLCAECPARAACLAGALERQEPWGVWGGEVFVGGVVVATKRGRGRPRKNAAPAA